MSVEASRLSLVEFPRPASPSAKRDKDEVADFSRLLEPEPTQRAPVHKARPEQEGSRIRKAEHEHNCARAEARKSESAIQAESDSKADLTEEVALKLAGDATELKLTADDMRLEHAASQEADQTALDAAILAEAPAAGEVTPDESVPAQTAPVLPATMPQPVALLTVVTEVETDLVDQPEDAATETASAEDNPAKTNALLLQGAAPQPVITVPNSEKTVAPAVQAAGAIVAKDQLLKTGKVAAESAPATPEASGEEKPAESVLPSLSAPEAKPAEAKPQVAARPLEPLTTPQPQAPQAEPGKLTGTAFAAPIVLPAPRSQAGAEAVATLRALPIQIGMNALKGLKEFTVRLDPAELGKVEVKLSMDDEGSVKAKLTVDRVDTLYLLQRDARTLERAFDQAGLKTSPDSLDFNLRDSGQGARQRSETQSPWHAETGTSPAMTRETETLLMRADLAQIRQIASAARGGVDLAI